MQGYADVVGVALQVAVYGWLCAIGCLLWYEGWKRESVDLRRAGDVVVLLGLCADVLLIATTWFFDWPAWLQSCVM